jgi:hypothetical protein
MGGTLQSTCRLYCRSWLGLVPPRVNRAEDRDETLSVPNPRVEPAEGLGMLLQGANMPADAKAVLVTKGTVGLRCVLLMSETAFQSGGGARHDCTVGVFNGAGNLTRGLHGGCWKNGKGCWEQTSGLKQVDSFRPSLNARRKRMVEPPSWSEVCYRIPP